MDRWSLEAECPRLKPKWRKLGNRASVSATAAGATFSPPPGTANISPGGFSQYLVMQSAYPMFLIPECGSEGA